MAQRGSSLRAGVIGWTTEARSRLGDVLGLEGVEVVAVGSSRPREVAACVGERGVAVYRDYRQLVAEQSPDVLIAFAPPHMSNDALRVAAERGVAVWKAWPPARTVAEAASVVSVFREHDALFWPQRIGRMAPEFRGVWGGGATAPAAVVCEIAVRRPAELGFLGDRERSGGGALLHDGWAWVDMIVEAGGLPEQVMGWLSRNARPQNRLMYDTEDTACVLVRFAGGTVGVVSVCWSQHRHGGRVVLETAEASRTWEVWPSGSGERWSGDAGGASGWIVPDAVADIVRFLEVASSQPVYDETCEEVLASLAVVEAGYLSSRTGQPEAPEQFYRLAGLRPPEFRTAAQSDSRGGSPVEKG